MAQRFTFTGDAAGFLGLGIINFLLTVITLGIYVPWAVVNYNKWRCRNTFLNGSNFVFEGEGSHLLGKFIIWYLLTIITCGIYWIWASVELEKWTQEHTAYAGETGVRAL
jgi:uncharacterized membrane protein YjgN (DUF898 family)